MLNQILNLLSIPSDFLMQSYTRNGIDIGNRINMLISDNILFIMTYSIVTTLIIIIMIASSVNKRNKYKRLKSQTINLGIYSAKWEFSDDDFLKQLCEENERLEREVKALSRELTNFSFMTFIVMLLLAIPYYIKEKLRKTTKSV